MSSSFGGPRPGGPGAPRPTAAPPPRRSRALFLTGAALVVLFLLLSSFASFWTERLWFKSVGYSGVFTTLLWTKVGLFLVFGGLMAATVATTIALGYRARPVLWPGMPGQPDDGLDRYSDLESPLMGWVVAGVSALMGIFADASATGQWSNFSLWRHGESFGFKDHWYRKDAGFYVFDLP